MPLILLCGGPCVGKTRRARDLYAYFQEQLANKENPSSWSSVHYINDESVLDKSTIYANPTEEKKVRATFMAAIERVLSPSTLVIADGMNYIKGYRYQLYCLVRSQQTTHCIVRSPLFQTMELFYFYFSFRFIAVHPSTLRGSGIKE